MFENVIYDVGIDGVFVDGGEESIDGLDGRVEGCGFGGIENLEGIFEVVCGVGEEVGNGCGGSCNEIGGG